jgi:hypothetical protein
MNNLIKTKKIYLILGLLMLSSAITITIAWKLYQLKNRAISPLAPEQSEAGPDQASEQCKISFIVEAPTPTVTPTGTLTPSPTPTLTLTPSPTPTGTLTPSPTPTVTLTPTPTPTLTPTPQPSSTPTPTVTPTVQPTNTPIVTNTPAPTATPTQASSPAPTKEFVVQATTPTPLPTELPKAGYLSGGLTIGLSALAIFLLGVIILL